MKTSSNTVLNKMPKVILIFQIILTIVILGNSYSNNYENITFTVALELVLLLLNLLMNLIWLMRPDKIGPLIITRSASGGFTGPRGHIISTYIWAFMAVALVLSYYGMV